VVGGMYAPVCPLADETDARLIDVAAKAGNRRF
jgi:hypothetical protein